MHVSNKYDYSFVMSTKCRVCDKYVSKNDENVVELKQSRAVENIRNCAVLRGLSWGNEVQVGDLFHSDCRKNFTKRDRIVVDPAPEISKPRTRQETSSSSSLKDNPFDYRTCCLFCCEVICERIYDASGNCTIKPLKKKQSEISFVKTKTWFDTSIRRQVKGRKDEWSHEVRGRVETVTCVRAEDAVYHRRCLQLFSLQRDKPTSDDVETPAKRKRGMKVENEAKNEAFLKLVEYFEESDEEHLTLKQCQEKMNEFIDEPYTTKWLKARFVQHYGDSIVVANHEGSEDVLFFKDSANSLLYEFYRQKRLEDDEDEKLRIIKLAADLIKSEMKEIITNKDSYFKLSDLDAANMLSFVPAGLQSFLNRLIPRRSKPNGVNIAALGQALIQLSRPNSLMCPLLLTLAVELHHKSGSEFLVSLLHAFGFCSSIEKVREFEKSLCFHESSSTSAESDNVSGIPLYAADNADVIQATLDGKNTVHIMGVVRAVVRRGSFLDKEIIVKKNPKKEDILKFAVPVLYANKTDKNEIAAVLKPLTDFKFAAHSNLALNWDAVRIAASLKKEVSEWSGFMRSVTKTVKIENKHNVEFLPFIDMDPNNPSTVYTTLMFVINECLKYGVDPVVTFDQPLWLKAMMMKKFHGLSITILLGNFHTQMSFLGSIGYVMKNSGLQELLATAYAETSVTKMLMGKQYERAMRAHDLLATVLKRKIFRQLSSDCVTLIEKLATHYDEMLSSGVDAMDIPMIETDSSCNMILSEYAKTCETLSASKLNKLWIMYIEMVDLLHMNLMAERTSNWNMYLRSLEAMLPFFAGTGHNHYARSIYWFLQEISELKPNILQEFKSGGFVVRRTNTYWSGVSPDLCIEQTLMASLKGSTGLTRGRSLTDVSRVVWVLSRPGVLTIDMKLKEMTCINFKSSEQHITLKQSRPSRISRNKSDMECMEKFVDSRHLLQLNAMSKLDGKLRNIATGLVAPESVTILDVKQCGERIVQKMNGFSPLTFSFKKEFQATQIPSSSTVSKKDTKLAIDPELLFQRLITVCSDEEVCEALVFELSHHPMSLFDDQGFMRDSKKPDFSHHLVKQYTFHDVIPDLENSKWIKLIDGGMLLHRLPWQVGTTFSSILDTYVQYVGRNFGEKTHIIFDGYLNSNTKDHCHRKRYPIQSNVIDFVSHMTLDCRKDLFLSNSTNKHIFVQLLVVWLITAGHTAVQHTDDADRVIAEQAITLAAESNVFVHADDADIFVLLLKKMKPTLSHCIYLRQEKSSRTLNLTTMVNIMPENKRINLLLSYALLGCDPVSGLHGIGKAKLIKSSILEDCDYSATFYDKNSPVDTIVQAGEKIILQLYGKSHSCVSLDQLRGFIFKRKLHSKTAKKKVDPRTLPPSSEAAKHHTLRAYHTIQEWIGNTLDPEKYGFVKVDGHYEPVTFNGPLAPERLIKTISCNCQKSNCQGGKCSCKNFGLYCTQLCGCVSENCCNVCPINKDTDADDVEDVKRGDESVN